MDGVNPVQIWRRIAMPPTKPALIVVALFEFKASCIPMVVIFFLGQRHFVQGNSTTGTRG